MPRLLFALQNRLNLNLRRLLPTNSLCNTSRFFGTNKLFLTNDSIFCWNTLRKWLEWVDSSCQHMSRAFYPAVEKLHITGANSRQNPQPPPPLPMETKMWPRLMPIILHHLHSTARIVTYAHAPLPHCGKTHVSCAPPPLASPHLQPHTPLKHSREYLSKNLYPQIVLI